jgi:hypothetical protein
MSQAPFEKWQVTLIVLSMIFLIVAMGLAIAALHRDVNKVFTGSKLVAPLPPTPPPEQARREGKDARIQQGSGITLSDDNVISLSPIPAFSIMGNTKNFPAPPTTWDTLAPGDLVAGRVGGKLALGTEGAALVSTAQPGNKTLPEWIVPNILDTPRGGDVPVKAGDGFLAEMVRGNLRIGFGITSNKRATTMGRLLIPVTVSLQTVVGSTGDAVGSVIGIMKDLIVPGYELITFTNCAIYGWQTDPLEAGMDVRATGFITANNATEIIVTVRLEHGQKSTKGHTLSLFGTCVLEIDLVQLF